MNRGITLSPGGETKKDGCESKQSVCGSLTAGAKILTGLKLGHSWTNALHDAASLVTQNDWEAIFVHSLKDVIEVSVAHTGGHNLWKYRKCLFILCKMVWLKKKGISISNILGNPVSSY